MMKGVNALVTGAASGLGRASAERIIRNGGRVVFADLEFNSDKLKGLSKHIISIFTQFS